MIWFRSLLFHAFFFSWLTLLLLMAWVFLPFHRDFLIRVMRHWSRIAAGALRMLGGVKSRFEDTGNLPQGAAVIACKHQSTWETFVLFLLVDDPQYILKKELLRIPFWSWLAGKGEHIAVDRDAGAKALRHMVADTLDRLEKGRQVVIFPEGTRTAPGESRRYHPGVAAIYQALPEGVPVVPVALNSGVHWGRRRFLIRPGTIVLEVGEPIPPGLGRKDFMATLETRIETAAKRLAAR